MRKSESDTENVTSMSSTCDCESQLYAPLSSPDLKSRGCCRRLSGDSACANHQIINSIKRSSNILGTGWFAADAANVKPGKTVTVIGDGSAGL